MNKYSTFGATLLFLFFFSFSVNATTISPFPNLGEMAKASDAVVYVTALENYTVEDGIYTRFRTSLQVLDVVKGDFSIDEQIDIQNYHLKFDDLEREVWGDLELAVGKRYLLFLDQKDNDLWQAQMLSYAAFEEHTKEGIKVLVPFDLGTEVHVHYSAGQVHAEPLAVYKTRDLITMLQSVVTATGEWNKKLAATDFPIPPFKAGTRTIAPGHCTYIDSSSPHARWDDFETAALPVRYHEDEDASCSNTVTQINNALGNVSGSYLGTNLTNAGTHSYVPTCGGGDGATDSEFTSWVSTNLGGTRHLVIQFDDPCSEIPDLSGCSGTLGIGGFYWFSSTHENGGCTWQNAAYGYVVVNNGTGACQCPGSDYEIMMTHELTHSLGIGHIATSDGTANMNPSCCNAIGGLDIECLDFTYPPEDLPVEIISFDGEARANSIALDWISASEFNNEFYTLERSNSAGEFEFLTRIAGVGDSAEKIAYQFIDEKPMQGTNYYRLSQTDFDGTSVYIETVAVPYYDKMRVGVSPNPIAGSTLAAQIETDVKGDVVLEVYDLTGNKILETTKRVDKGNNNIQLTLEDLSVGIYYLRVTQHGLSETIRFVKN